MEIRFDDQVVLITGASTGIGAALARAFGEAGARVVVHYNQSADEAKQVAQDLEVAGGKALVIQADVSQSDGVDHIVERTMAEYGRIDILINNAGGLLQRVAIADAPEELYDRIFDLNTRSVFSFCNRVVPIMQSQGKGNIIIVTSIAARSGGAGGSTLYAASKSAVSSITRGLAKEVAAQNIRVNALSPGVILTPFHERYTGPEQMKGMIASIPMGRAGVAEECVGTVFFLASDTMSGYVTGQIIEVDGGQLMP